MNWKGVMPAITTSFHRRSARRSQLHDPSIAGGCWTMVARESSRSVP